MLRASAAVQDFFWRINNIEQRELFYKREYLNAFRQSKQIKNLMPMAFRQIRHFFVCTGFGSKKYISSFFSTMCGFPDLIWKKVGTIINDFHSKDYKCNHLEAVYIFLGKTDS